VLLADGEHLIRAAPAAPLTFEERIETAAAQQIAQRCGTAILANLPRPAATCPEAIRHAQRLGWL
jgi:hypothetical protein